MLLISQVFRLLPEDALPAIRGSTSDDRVGCSASDGRCAPARPALDVSTRLLPFLPARSRVPMVLLGTSFRLSVGCALCDRCCAGRAGKLIDDLCRRRALGCRVFGTFHYCGSCDGRADAPETSAGEVLHRCRYRTFLGSSRESKSLRHL